MRPRSLALSVAALLGGCSDAETFVRSPETVHAICPSGVEFFSSPATVPGVYREVALIPVESTVGRRQEGIARAAYRQHAGALGANGVILTSGAGAAGWTKVMGPAIGDSSQRRGMAVAIYIPADSGRVKEACNPPATAPSSAPRPPLASRRPGVKSAAAPPRDRSPSTRDRTREPGPASRDSRPAARLPEEPTESDSLSFLRNRDVRSALENLERLKIVSGAEEVRPGLLRLSVDEMGSWARMDYHIGLLHASYQATRPYGEETVVELWSKGRKVGEYTRDGLLVGPEYSDPR